MSPRGAKFNDILGAIGELDIVALIDMPNIAGAQPTIFSHRIGRLSFVVATGNPGTAQLQLTHAFTIVRQTLSTLSDNPDFHRGYRTATLGSPDGLVASSKSLGG